LRPFTGWLSKISNLPERSKQVLSLRLRAGLNVIILRGGTEDESEHRVDDVVDDESTTLAFELEGGEASEDAKEETRNPLPVSCMKKKLRGQRNG
jgi:hypothetical protein